MCTSEAKFFSFFIVQNSAQLKPIGAEVLHNSDNVFKLGKKSRKFYTVSVSVSFGFTLCGFFEWFLSIVLHSECKEWRSLKVKGGWPLRWYHQSLHRVAKSFVRHLTHQITQATTCVSSWWYHGPTIDELQETWSWFHQLWLAEFNVASKYRVLPGYSNRWQLWNPWLEKQHHRASWNSGSPAFGLSTAGKIAVWRWNQQLLKVC